MNKVILPGIDLGQDGEHRRERLEQLAAQSGFYWSGRPSVGRWIKHMGDEKMLSRKDEVVITWREWVKNENEQKWLTVKTDKTGDRQFRIVGIRAFDSTAPHDDKVLLDSTVKLGRLHCVPVASDLLANVKNGINFQIGVMDDGLNDLCGELVFARLVNMTNEIYDPSYKMFETAWQAARIFARTGIKQAAQFLRDSELFEDVYTFQVGGPSCADDCVIEIEHESRP